MSEVTMPGVYVQELPSGIGPVVPAPTNITAFVGRTQTGAAGSAATVTGIADYFSQLGPVSADLPLSLAVRDYFNNGGGVAIVLSVGSPTAPLSDAEWLAAVNGLGAAPQFNILALSPDVPGEDVPSTVTMAAVAQCAALGATAILGPLASWQVAFEAQTLDTISVDNLGPLPLSSRQAAAVYFPNLLVPDPQTTQPIAASPVGAVAGVWVSTTVENGVWVAPAGVNHGLIGADGLTAALTDANDLTLTGAGVNALRSMVNYGLVIWGAKTLTGVAGSMDPWRYIQIRRTLIYIEQSLKGSLNWVAFQPNNARLWPIITQVVSQFLTTIWQSGGMFGGTQAEAFSVICDASNNTPADMAAGVVNVQIQVALLAPAEFQVIQLQFEAAAT
ncbi:phage tail sheath protein FI [Caulobacter ginsengisoli]|uniref:Phage tail sheath protein FI n=1 Tax=Caulobacter ginsengisoli TaxID=400775 RepID=A0ABU0IMJ3_9CAUL|nr:phage tail sheath C-terminal domain-containing protein [Caulobacter ginsengisoli]MDQ0463189.1 phage tail sheath protein FI [Caulobacter ginsengisoli]